jgi:GDPmannose 4,6-dehydratase
VRFVTQKIVDAAVRIELGSGQRLTLGNIAIRRDWGWAPEYVEAMHLMLQIDMPEDFVIATGNSHSLEEFVSAVFEFVGLDWREHVDFDDNFRRPTDIAEGRGDAGKAERVLEWRARTTMHDVVAKMIDARRSLLRELPGTVTA